jgi:hypothetical protein
MDVYIYQGGLYCEDCARIILEEKRNMFSDDSDERPCGPYPDGGGESDTPQHCEDCGCFLENSLTEYGLDYVRESVRECVASDDMDSVAIKEWAPFYCIDPEEFMDEDDEDDIIEF